MSKIIRRKMLGGPCNGQFLIVKETVTTYQTKAYYGGEYVSHLYKLDTLGYFVYRPRKIPEDQRMRLK